MAWDMNRALDVATSLFASIARGGAGLVARSHARVPEKPLELYEFEACPFCRKVREALTAFDMDAVIYPCPRGSRHRAVVLEKGGKELFPYLVDPNAGTAMYESDDIIRYLSDTYGDGKIPLGLSLGPLTLAGSMMASLPRLTKGGRARPAKAPEKPLELYSFEASPFSRIVREVLCELQLPYLLHNVGKKGARRSEFIARSGKMMVPYLVDPNTDTAMFESADIVAYLERTYGA